MTDNDLEREARELFEDLDWGLSVDKIRAVLQRVRDTVMEEAAKECNERCKVLYSMHYEIDRLHEQIRDLRHNLQSVSLNNPIWK